MKTDNGKSKLDYESEISNLKKKIELLESRREHDKFLHESDVFLINHLLEETSRKSEEISRKDEKLSLFYYKSGLGFEKMPRIMNDPKFIAINIEGRVN